MKILITGGTGFVGTCLTRKLLDRGDEVTLLSTSGRTPLAGEPAVDVLQADTTRRGEWQDGLGRFDVIINLTGRSVFHLWSDSYKNAIYSSRVHTTRNIVDALPNNSDTVLLSASAAGYYGDRGETEQDESSPAGEDFLAEVCKNWEEEAFLAREKGARVATMRFGVVLGSQGGAIATMKTPFLLCLGGPIGSGKQWFPWIHVDDLVSAILFLMDGSDLQGAYNFTAPGLVRQKEFAKTLGEVMSRPALIPAPSFVMKTILGEFGKSLLQGQKVVPRNLRNNGFVFKYPELEEALREIING